MRKVLMMIAVALIAATAAPKARADSYTYSLVGAGVSAGTSITIDSTGPATDGTIFTPPTRLQPTSTDNSVGAWGSSTMDP